MISTVNSEINKSFQYVSCEIIEMYKLYMDYKFNCLTTILVKKNKK